VEFLYGYTAKTLLTENGQITGLKIARDNTHEILTADAVILATGGFQANGEMMRQHLGPKAEMMRLISPGTCFNTGDGIRMAFEIGATGAGDWSGMHAEPVDARSKSSAPVVLVYPYGVVVDQNGWRFFDEGGGLVHETWEWFARNIHFKTPNSIAYAILDSRFLEISDYQRAIRSEIPPVRGDTLADLAKLLGVNGANLEQTIATYNVSCTGDLASFDATRCDGLVASNDLHPPKSNWARAIEVPPFFGYPLVGAIAYTFGGLATDEHARVMRAGTPIPGLYAAGEITGHFYTTAPNAVSILRALVFGRIAGREAVANLRPN
jgi:tricarballylate dehydrogenase